MNLEKSSKSQVRETLYTTKLRSPGHLRESSLEMKKSIIFGKKKKIKITSKKILNLV